MAAATESPTKFAKPADLFKMRNSSSSCPAFEAQSPLKCLNNLAEPSPIKKLPTLLRNPFRNHQPAKRRLELGSPIKRNKMLEIDEDANLEPPKMRINTHLQSKKKSFCYEKSWVLNTKVKINFSNECKNWLDSTTSTHKRNIENSPRKVADEDNTISIEAIKNAARVYQHPYLAWQPLYPRLETDYDSDIKSTMKLTPDSDIAKMLRSDWAKSFEDLTNLLLYGNCPYFYMLTDINTMFFKQVPSSNPSKPSVQVYISPFFNGMGFNLNKLDIEFKPIEVERVTRTNLNISNSSDSANVSDFIDEDEEEQIKLTDDTSQLVEDMGIGDLEFKPTRKNCLIGLNETSSSQMSSSTTKGIPLVMIEGRNNIRKLIKFLQTNSSYTTKNCGKFACIPPTLLSPCEFRLSTPQYPEVTQSKNMVVQQSEMIESSSTPVKPAPKVVNGSSFVEISGTIIPNFYKELHKMLTISDNIENHLCQSVQLKSSVSFGSVQELP